MKILYWVLYVLTILFLFVGVMSFTRGSDTNNPPIVYIILAIITFILARWTNSRHKVRK